MADFGIDLEIIQDENYAIKAPKGFKGEAWTSKSGRPGRVLYDKHSPDYYSSDCYVTVSTVSRQPMTDEIRRRIEKHLGEDGFSFSFEEVAGRHVVFYSSEAEADYKTYHSIVMLSDNKAVMMDVVFNMGFDNSKEIAKNIMSSIHPNFPSVATDEEVATDMARFKAEDEAEAAKEAAKKAQVQAASGAVKEAPTVKEEASEVKPADAVADTKTQALNALDAAEAAVSTAPEMHVEQDGIQVDTTADVVDAEVEEIEEELAEAVEEKPNFDNVENGKEKSLIYDTLSNKGRITLSELQSIPGLVDLGRMETTKILNGMIKDKFLIRLEEADNIYFALPGGAAAEKKEEAKPAVGQGLTPEEQYKIDMERYELAMKQWKKSKGLFGKKGTMEKPVEPVKPASMK
ncbi:MAG: hypothetical protein K5656_10730 [Lachnospiraceae bacterium]|nr:hypothetical protein [Lachnospiraceae bacterium]